MNINRNNYETFFLLYVDNELSAADRKAVESFAEQHPDIKKELEQLTSLVLPADELVFTGKKDLLKCEVDTNISEEKLLLYLDNELSAGEANEMGKMIELQGALKTDWKIWQQTKLDATDKIIFTDKHVLYRKERDNVISGRFVKWAVAAMLLGFGLYIGFSVSHERNPAETAATKTHSTEDISTKLAGTPVPKAGNDSQQILSSDRNNATADLTVPAISGTKSDNVTHSPGIKEKTKVNIARQEDMPEEPVLQNSNTVNPALANNSPKNTPEKTDIEKTAREMAVALPRQNPEPAGNNPEVSPNTMLASIADIGEDGGGDRILYVKEQTVSRTKVGGLFKRLKNAVEKGSNIKIGKSIKIANFEIALN